MNRVVGVTGVDGVARKTKRERKEAIAILTLNLGLIITHYMLEA